MDSELFERICKFLISEYFNEHKEETCKFTMTPNDVYIVWNCRTLQNNKALVSTIVLDKMYYEITYNGDNDEIYLDAYKKEENQVHSFNDILKELNKRGSEEEISNEDN